VTPAKPSGRGVKPYPIRFYVSCKPHRWARSRYAYASGSDKAALLEAFPGFKKPQAWQRFGAQAIASALKYKIAEARATIELRKSSTTTPEKP